MGKAILVVKPAREIIEILNDERKAFVLLQNAECDVADEIYLCCAKEGDRLLQDIKGNIAIDNEHYAYGDEDLNGKVVGKVSFIKKEKVDGKTDWLCRSLNQMILFGEIAKDCKEDEIVLYKKLNGNIGYVYYFEKPVVFEEAKDYTEYAKIFCKFDSTSYAVNLLRELPEEFCYIYVD